MPPRLAPGLRGRSIPVLSYPDLVGAADIPSSPMSTPELPLPKPEPRTTGKGRSSSSPGVPAVLPPAPRPCVEALEAYVPGEQPKDPQLIKLNTNESPYPPPPVVVDAISEACVESGARLRLYPDPTLAALREAIARECRVQTTQVIPTNGSDEILRMLCMAWLEPGDVAVFPWPTYSLYDTLVGMVGGNCVHLAAEAGAPLPLPAPDTLARHPKLYFLANPNPPYGTFHAPAEVARIAEALPKTLIVVDEAYAAFAPGHCVSLLASHANVFITRTFSKSYSLAGLRLGWGIGHVRAIEALEKIRDSYNINRLTLAGGVAALSQPDYWAGIARRIIATRERVRAALLALGFEVPESAGNFLFPRRGPIPADVWYKELRERHILVRYFRLAELADGARVTIGTDAQMDAFLAATHEIIAAHKPATR